MQLCTRDGTPEQARNAVYTLAKLLTVSKSTENIDSPKEKSRQDLEAFLPLLKALTASSRMSITSKENCPKIVSILSALAALSDCAPRVVGSLERGKRAIKFALQTILLGRNEASENSSDMSDASDTSDEETAEVETPSSSRKRRSSLSDKRDGNKHTSPESKFSLLEDENLSVACRRLCAAIEFLVTHVRSSLLSNLKAATADAVASSIADQQVEQIFNVVAQILRDKGMPPSSRDRRHCKARQDRAALRQCAATYLLRLCDTRLGLEKKYLTSNLWHILSESFLDEEFVVRQAVVEEFSHMLQGSGVYGPALSRAQAKPPTLRMLSFISLCSDGHGIENDAANGNAANLGKSVNAVKSSAQSCVVNMRKVCDALFAQCRANGKESERRFESQFKMLVMPEYVVPYAFHLLSHRRETPSSMGAADDAESHLPAFIDDDSQHRVLRKRLRLLFEPLVLSLGDKADNISFLLRMTEILGKHFAPVDAAPGLSKPSHSPLSVGCDSSLDTNSPGGASKRAHTLRTKLRTVCSATRQVLLSFVKNDVNLSGYPGVIQLPNTLFKRLQPTLKNTASSSEARLSLHDGSQEDLSQKLSPSQGNSSKERSPEVEAPSHADVGSSVKYRKGSASKSRVHFSPEVEYNLSARRGRISAFGDTSPIPKSASPTTVHEPDSGATMGSSPPSALRIATIASTAPVSSGEKSSKGSTSHSLIGAGRTKASLQDRENTTQEHLFDDECDESGSTPESRPKRKKKVKAATSQEAEDTIKHSLEDGNDSYFGLPSTLESSQESSLLKNAGANTKDSRAHKKKKDILKSKSHDAPGPQGRVKKSQSQSAINSKDVDNLSFSSGDEKSNGSIEDAQSKSQFLSKRNQKGANRPVEAVPASRSSTSRSKRKAPIKESSLGGDTDKVPKQINIKRVKSGDEATTEKRKRKSRNSLSDSTTTETENRDNEAMPTETGLRKKGKRTTTPSTKAPFPKVDVITASTSTRLQLRSRR